MPYGTARASSLIRKSCTRTPSGSPCGRHSRPPYPTRHYGGFDRQLLQAAPDRAGRNGRGQRHCRDPAISSRSRFSGSQQASVSLVQMCQKGGEAVANRRWIAAAGGNCDPLRPTGKSPAGSDRAEAPICSPTSDRSSGPRRDAESMLIRLFSPFSAVDQCFRRVE